MGNGHQWSLSWDAWVCEKQHGWLVKQKLDVGSRDVRESRSWGVRECSRERVVLEFEWHCEGVKLVKLHCCMGELDVCQVCRRLK